MLLFVLYDINAHGCRVLQSASPELSKAAACDLPPTTLASAKLDLGDAFLVADLALRGDDWGTRACRAANQAYEVAHFSCNDLCYLTLSPCPGIPPHPTCHPAPARPPAAYITVSRAARARECVRAAVGEIPGRYLDPQPQQHKRLRFEGHTCSRPEAGFLSLQFTLEPRRNASRVCHTGTSSNALHGRISQRATGR